MKAKMMLPKREVKKVRIYLHFGGRDTISLVYTGRLLAWLDDRQFATLIKHKELREKMLTSESVDVRGLYDESVDPGLDGKRLVIAVTTKEDEPIHKTLFISERISDFTFCEPDSMTLETEGENSWLTIESIKKKG